MLLLYSVNIGASGKRVSDANKCDTIKGNLYLKFNIDIKKRNFLLSLVPRLYAICDSSRFHVGEVYGNYEYIHSRNSFYINEKLRIGTIRNQSTVFPNLLDFVTPHIYDETVINDYILSPFHRKNRRFYRFTSMPLGDLEYIRFKPRTRNSTLTAGTALMDRRTRKIINARFTGSYDLIGYDVDVTMDTARNVPDRCLLNAQFKFAGNNIVTSLDSRYDSVAILTGKIQDSNSPRLMEKVRTDTLTTKEREAYDKVYHNEEDEDSTVVRKKKKFLQRTGDILYDYLIRRPSISADNRELSMSPILDPFAIGYSGNTGVSYRVSLWAWLATSKNTELTLNPTIGYNFRQEQLYVDAPLRYTFNKRRDGWIELFFSNGNHISNGILLDKIKNVEKRDTIDWDKLDIDYFRNYEWALRSDIPIGDLFHVGLGAVYHKRSAINPDKLRELGEKTVYHSFAPSLTLKYIPSSYVSYVFNYERGIPNILGCESSYERMELDAQFAVRYNKLTSLNIRVGGGVYTNMDSNDFVDYKNFSENYLPDRWDDDWTGRFFLLNSDLYNASKYYIRSNISYESPMLPLAYLPVVGYYVEKERIYISNVQLYKTSPYTEMGYAFTTRYFSFGMFASFFGKNFQEFGTKINIELFNRW